MNTPDRLQTHRKESKAFSEEDSPKRKNSKHLQLFDFEQNRTVNSINPDGQNENKSSETENKSNSYAKFTLRSDPQNGCSSYKTKQQDPEALDNLK
jgi:hypothetical protein